MKLFLDTCVSGHAVLELRSAGHDVVWSGEWYEDPGDEAILERAHLEGRILVKLDKDFGELAVVYDKLHSGIIRLVDFRVMHQATVCMRVLDRYGDDLQRGAIITVEHGRLRIREATFIKM
jgi:predicted nuclease of predicted toxin-antitoxin system